jgi:hypothetical protein
MVWTQADLDTIDAAIAGGAVVQSMTFADQSFTFRSIAEMLQVRAMIAAALATGSGAAPGYRLASTSKGV